MPGEDVLFLRIDPALKERLKKAAQARGESVTTFVTKAVEKTAKEVEMKAAAVQKQSERVFRGVPSFFRAMCYEAAQGGTSSYSWAGKRFFNFIKAEVEGDTESERDEKLEELEQLLDAVKVWRNPTGRDAEDQAVFAWFEREFPRCMELVPRRRWAQFLKGVYEEFAEEGMSR